jgi:hypothetical protein
MRPTLYWLTSSAVAVISMRAVAVPSDEEAVLAAVHPLMTPLAVSESARAVLLGIGIMAVAFTYRRAWLNRRQTQG